MLRNNADARRCSYFELGLPVREPNAILEYYRAFQDFLSFLNRHMIVWFSWICSICEIY